MKNFNFLLFFLILLLPSRSNAQELPYRHRILEKMVLANNYFMAKWPDPTLAIVTDKTRPSNIWTRGTYYEGLMALYYINRDTNLYKYAVDWGTFHKWEPAYGGTTTRHADNHCCMQTYLELYNLDKKEERRTKVKTCIDNMINSTKRNDWTWIDALQMAMPVYAKLGTIYNDNKYFNAMYELYSFPRYRSKGVGLYNTSDHIWWRDSSFLPPVTTSHGKQVYWSRGNGWVLAAFARVLDVMPAGAPHRDEYVTTFTEMSQALIAIQRTDGFWNVSLADSLDYGGKETSGTAFFTYGLAWGINKGYLDEATYKPYVIKGWNGMVNDALHSNGFLGYVQGTGKQPSDGQPVTYTSVPNFEDYGLGAFLLAGSEVYKLAVDSTSTGNKTINANNETALLTVYPNPFSNIVHISYRVNDENSVNINIYDMFGNIVYSFRSNKRLHKGIFNETWNGVGQNGKNLPNGMYIVRFQCGNYVKTQKINLLR
jgi:rhamnogalacturonyl hydrolase YesR